MNRIISSIFKQWSKPRKNKQDKEALHAHFHETVKKFDDYWNDSEQEHKICTELGFTWVDDGCDGFCPECEQMMTCKVYEEELKEEWERFYL